MISRMFNNYKERTQKHIENVQTVFNYIFSDDQFKEYFDDMGIYYENIKETISNHDSSKFGIEEMLGYILMTEKYGRKVGYKFSKEDDEIMARAWDHHKSVNRHHPEFFEDKLHIMKTEDLIEMCCDWGAMSLEFRDSVVEFKENKAYNKYEFTDSQKAIIDFCCETIEKCLKEW